MFLPFRAVPCRADTGAVLVFGEGNLGVGQPVLNAEEAQPLLSLTDYHVRDVSCGADHTLLLGESLTEDGAWAAQGMSSGSSSSRSLRLQSSPLLGRFDGARRRLDLGRANRGGAFAGAAEGEAEEEQEEEEEEDEEYLRGGGGDGGSLMETESEATDEEGGAWRRRRSTGGAGSAVVQQRPYSVSRLSLPEDGGRGAGGSSRNGDPPSARFAQVKDTLSTEWRQRLDGEMSGKRIQSILRLAKFERLRLVHQKLGRKEKQELDSLKQQLGVPQNGTVLSLEAQKVCWISFFLFVLLVSSSPPPGRGGGRKKPKD